MIRVSRGTRVESREVNTRGENCSKSSLYSYLPKLLIYYILSLGNTGLGQWKGNTFWENSGSSEKVSFNLDYLRADLPPAGVLRSQSGR